MASATPRTMTFGGESRRSTALFFDSFNDKKVYEYSAGIMTMTMNRIGDTDDFACSDGHTYTRSGGSSGYYGDYEKRY